ncbi:MAG: DUF1569 domain-containing protein [Spirochaetales bacterium]|nr:DUF1569 domain-containing protein [Spirochaetales bacterium]
MTYQFSSLKEVKEILSTLKEGTLPEGYRWDYYQILTHCSKTIEYAMSGYPKLKPALVRGTVGKWVIRKFLAQGFMKHNLSADVPGSEEVQREGDFSQGIEILTTTINKFLSHEGVLKTHLMFGNLSKEDYDKYFSLHLAEHLNIALS